MKYIWQLLKDELTSGQTQDHLESEYKQKRENVYIFLRLPWALEKFMIYGFLQCVDCFLYICSYLPLRLLFVMLQAFHNPLAIRQNIRKLFEPSRMIDFCKLFLIVVCYLMLTFVDTSMVYHIIRGQAIIKLYIFFNMLEVADRLLSSIGQDVLDALFWTASEPRKPKYLVLPHLLISLIYVFCHSMVILCQTTTLNVAFNSHNKALLTIMMSNNFVELKGSVFKKFDKVNVFQMACSDVKERFHFLILLLMILMRNMAEFDWEFDQLCELIPIFMIIFFAEFFIDWIKHAFVLKFNDIPTEVFKEYKMTLAYDLTEAKQKLAVRNHADIISQRYGFIPIPLFCLLIRILVQSIKFTNFISFFNVFFAFICLIVMKTLNDIVLLGISLKCIKEEKDRMIRECSAVVEASDPESPTRQKPMPKPARRRRITEVSSIGSLEGAALVEKSDKENEALNSFKDRKSSVISTSFAKRLALVRTRNKLMKKNLERLHQRRKVYSNEK